MLERSSLPPAAMPAPPRPRRWPRRVALALVLGASGAGAWWGWKATAAPPVPSVPTAVVTRGDVEDFVTAVGRLEPRDFVDVGTQVSGQLRRIHVAIGARVKQGDLLAELDPTLFQSRVDADRAQLAKLSADAAERDARLTLARQQLTRQRNLARQNATSTEAVQSAEAEVKALEASIRSLEAQSSQIASQLRGNEANLSYTRIFAPMDGTVVSITAKQGQTLNANQSAPIILRIADLSTMTVWTQVSESDVGRLVLGMPASFTTFADQSRRWRGTLRQVMPTPEVVNNVVLYNAVFDATNEIGPSGTGLLLPNMTAQVFFEIGSAQGVTVLPLTALRAPLDGTPPGPGEAYSVAVLRGDGEIENRPIRVGVQNRIAAEILSGVTEGERVLAEGRISRRREATRVVRGPSR